MSQKLVAYFSASGTTRTVGDELAKIIGADVYEIVPKVLYKPVDLDWHDDQSRSSIEMKDVNSRPELADHDAKIENYDEIFLGFPIWWYEAPRLIHTFLESYDFTGKKIVTFATSGGSGFGETLNKLKATCPTANWEEGKVFSSHPSKSQIRQWVKTVK